MNYFCFIFVCIYHAKCIRSQNIYNSILLFFSFYLNHCCHIQFLCNNFKSCIKYHLMGDDLFCKFLLLNIVKFLHFYFYENGYYPSVFVFVTFRLNAVSKLLRTLILSRMSEKMFLKGPFNLLSHQLQEGSLDRITYRQRYRKEGLDSQRRDGDPYSPTLMRESKRVWSWASHESSRSCFDKDGNDCYTQGQWSTILYGTEMNIASIMSLELGICSCFIFMATIRILWTNFRLNMMWHRE